MTKKNNKISVSKFEQMMKFENKDNTTIVPIEGVDGLEVEITRTLSLRDVIEFVENTVASCIDITDGNYEPEVIDFLIRKETLTRYANFTMPQNIEKQYELIYNTSAFDLVQNHINQQQFYEITTSIKNKIRYTIDCMNSTASASIMSIANKIESISEQGADIFKGLDSEGMSNILENMNKIVEMDEDKIIRAIKGTQN